MGNFVHHKNIEKILNGKFFMLEWHFVTETNNYKLHWNVSLHYSLQNVARLWESFLQIKERCRWIFDAQIRK